MEGLPVMEQFLSIQGEGAHQDGLPGSFAWEDVMLVASGAMSKSWDVTAHPVVSVAEILAGIPENFGGIVVVPAVNRSSMT